MGRWLFWGLSAVGLCYMVWSMVFSDHGYLVYRQEAMQTAELRGELKELQVERERLAQEVLRLRNDPDALEELVHRELGYVYPDEIILVMPEHAGEEEEKVSSP
ncbi:cell division protein FtsB [Mariprofundus aestuarium]|uniref:Cell division protein FtsB n=1 Tax=Mariprofundus aestuarium TaxID=1921086 RepID=A0A2K8KZL3_MARES|nr:septum formation initiator family protein [Mariprofundus aestuarium]ATX80383.1 cell division protein FtsB [Mariprofundus aestuarium]